MLNTTLTITLIALLVMGIGINLTWIEENYRNRVGTKKMNFAERFCWMFFGPILGFVYLFKGNRPEPK